MGVILAHISSEIATLISLGYSNTGILKKHNFRIFFGRKTIVTKTGWILAFSCWRIETFSENGRLVSEKHHSSKAIAQPNVRYGKVW